MCSTEYVWDLLSPATSPAVRESGLDTILMMLRNLRKENFLELKRQQPPSLAHQPQCGTA